MNLRTEHKEPASRSQSKPHSFTSIKISPELLLLWREIADDDAYDPDYNRFKGISDTAFAGFDTDGDKLFLINPFTNQIKTISCEDKSDKAVGDVPHTESFDETSFACVYHDKVELRCVETAEIQKVLPLSYPMKGSTYEITSVKKSLDGNFLLILVTESADSMKYHAQHFANLPYSVVLPNILEMATKDGFTPNGFIPNPNSIYTKSHLFIVDVETEKTLYIEPVELVKDMTLIHDQLVLALYPAGISVVNFDIESQKYAKHSALLGMLKINKIYTAVDGKLITHSVSDDPFEKHNQVSLHDIDVSSEPWKIKQTKKITKIDDPERSDTKAVMTLCNSVVYYADNAYREFHFENGSDHKLKFSGKKDVDIFGKLTDGSLVLVCRNHDNEPEFIICKLASVNDYKIRYAKKLKKEQEVLTTQIDAALQPKVTITKDVLNIISKLAVPNRLGLFSAKEVEKEIKDMPAQSLSL